LNYITLPHGAIENLLARREWIYMSERVEVMLAKLSVEQLYSVFNFQHHIQCATQLFEFLGKKNKKVAVVYGNKAQGKSQFLFFVFKLLQEMGEKAIYLDKTMLSLKSNNKINASSANFCGHLWKESFQSDGPVQCSLDNFYADATPEMFGLFFFALREYAETSKIPVWVIVDEVASFESFPIDLPSDQDIGPLKWIVTGSAGIGTWVTNLHLERYVFDLPLFTKSALNLQSIFAHH